VIFSVVILVALFIAVFVFGKDRGKKEKSEELRNYLNQVAHDEFQRGVEMGKILGEEEALQDFTILQKPLIRETGSWWWEKVEITCKTELLYRGFPIKLGWQDGTIYEAKIDNFPQIEAQLDAAISLPGDLGKGNMKVEVKPSFETKKLSQSQKQSLVDFLNGKYSNERKISRERKWNESTTIDVIPSPRYLSGSQPRLLPPSK
jgi:hypothetical protein